MLVVSLAEGGPDGHSATVALPGRFARGSFEQLAPAVRLDHGPDFYAMQTFFDAPHGSAVGMGWMNSWRYANQVPSRGRRGVLSLPRQFAFDDVGELCSWPVSLPHHRVEDGAQWLTTTDDVVVEISGVDGVAAVAGVLDGVAFIERFGDLVEGYAARYELELAVHGQHLVVVDHGTVEVFAAGGHVAMSAQVFAGPDWTVRIA
jgi:sucrose-6-phosphate hydrolase SacC (GH32 family)